MKPSVCLIILAGVLSTACSNEEGASGREAAQGKNAGQGAAVSGSPSAKGDTSAESQQQPAMPSRSELRVMAEETKAVEGSVKEVIERFDANLGDRNARRAAEKEFKAMLPEYKEKMLQIGKAQLQKEQ